MAVLALKLQNSGQTGIRKPLQSAPRGEHTFLIILFHILTKATAILFYFIFFFFLFLSQTLRKRLSKLN